MAFLAKRVQAALTAFMQPNAVKSYSNGWGDLLYGGASGLLGHNRDLSFSEQGIATAFGINTGLQRGIRFKQDALGMLKWGIYDSNTNELLLSLSDRTLDMSKPGATLLTALRTYSTRHYHDFIGNIIFSNNMYGESYVLRLSNPLGGVTGVRWLNPLFTEPDIQRGKIVQFRYSAGEGYFTLPVSDMAFNIYHPNPHDDLRGLPPALSALDSMTIERNEKRAVQAYFRNGMNPGIAMSPKGETTHLHDTEIAKMEARFRQMYGGVDNMFRALITPTEFLYHAFEQPDLQKNWSIIISARTEVTMAIGVPVELAGDPSGTKYENADKVMQNWLRVNGKAEANGIASFVTDNLLCHTDPGAEIYFGYDTSDIDRQDAGLVQADYSGGFITINEARAQRGYEVDPALAGILNFGGKPVHRDVLIQLANDPTTLTGAAPAPSRWGSAAQIPGQVNAPPALPEVVEPQKGAASLWVGLSLSNNPDLIDLQKRLKALYPDPAIKWNDPAEFHITLLYCPAVEDDQVNEFVPALDIKPDGLSLKVGSLACFDNVGEHALHFRISRNSALLDMQSALFDTCDSIGLQMSGYSRPDNYTPHITMGYLPENSGRIVFHGKVKVTPDDVVCSVERGGEQEDVWRSSEPDTPEPEDTLPETEKTKHKGLPGSNAVIEVVEAPPPATLGSQFDGINQNGDEPHLPHSHVSQSVVITHGDHAHTLPVVTRDYSPDAALKELKAWRVFTGKKHARPFTFVMLRGDPADDITARLAAGETPDAIVDALKGRFDGSRLKDLRAAFAAAINAVIADDDAAVIKSIDSIRSDFEDRFGAVVESMQAGDLSSRQRAGNIIRQLLRMFGARAYRQGLEDAGVDDTPDEDEQAEINSLLSAQSSFVSGLTTAMINEGITPAQADGKAQLWFNGSVSPFYSAGLLAGNKNIMLQFQLGDTEDHCPDCPRLNKQIHRAKDWKKRNLDGIPRVGQATTCGGWRCRCQLVPVTGKASGSW